MGTFSGLLAVAPGSCGLSSAAAGLLSRCWRRKRNGTAMLRTGITDPAQDVSQHSQSLRPILAFTRHTRQASQACTHRVMIADAVRWQRRGPCLAHKSMRRRFCAGTRRADHPPRGRNRTARGRQMRRRTSGRASSSSARALPVSSLAWLMRNCAPGGHGAHAHERACTHN